MVTITEVFNNTPCRREMVTSFGFSCYLHEAGILFDTGGDGAVLRANLDTAGVDGDRIQMIVLSHDDWDHVDGLPAALEFTRHPEVVVHDRFSGETMDRVGARGNLRIVRGWEELAPGIATTGPLPGPPAEQSLVVDTDRGAVIITGCAHPHISRVIAAVRERTEVRGTIGGFHGVSDDDIRALRDLEFFSASHCTQRMDDLRTLPRFVPGGAGAVHRI
ncbi:MAG: MBL fold metallo-hydrolase [Methanomicrobiales archaeon]